MKKFPALLFLFAISIYSINAQSISKADIEKLDEYYSKMTKEWDVPSVSIGIVKDGKLVFTGNYGVLDVNNKTKPDENSLYAIASNSKAFTSALTGMMVQEGKLDWNDKVVDYLPYFSLFNDPWISSKVNIRDILSHRVGLGTFSGDVMWYKANLTAEDYIKRAAYLPKAFDFRDGYGYSNLMYITAGEIMKVITGKNWGENVKERILDPLEMNRTITTAKDLEKMKNYATPHGRVDEVNIAIEWEDWEEIGAMGGIISSVNDMAKWMIFNLNHGIYNNDTLLNKQSINLIWTPHNNFVVDHTQKDDFGRHFRGYGLGWSLGDYHGNFMAGHTGGFDGMISAVTLIPEEKLGIVVLTNGHKSPYMAATYHALDVFLGMEYKDWSAKFLERYENYMQRPSRIEKIKESRISGTKPSLNIDSYTGTYKSDIYGNIFVRNDNGELILEFEHSPELSAKLKHWHFDVWEIIWDYQHAWFDFGTLNFITDNNMKITGLEFEVPNNDIFFDELKPYKISD